MAMAAKKPHRALVRTPEEQAQLDEQRQAKVRARAWKADVMEGQRKCAMFPTSLGRDAFGACARLEAYELAATAAAGYQPGKGRRLLYLRNGDGAIGDQLTYTAEATRPSVHLSSEGGGADAFLRTLGPNSQHGPRRSCFAELSRKRPHHAYTPPGPNGLAAVLCISRFGGDLPAPNRHLVPSGGARKVLREALAEQVRIIDTDKTRDFSVAVNVHADDECQWRATGMPDAVVAPGGSRGAVDACMVGGACCLVFELSTGNGATSDFRGVVLGILMTGCIVESARESLRREFVENGRPLPGGLRKPLLIAGLPKDWGKMERRDDAALTSRVWEFRWDSGVAYRRSVRLTLLGALHYIFSGLQM